MVFKRENNMRSSLCRAVKFVRIEKMRTLRITRGEQKKRPCNTSTRPIPEASHTGYKPPSYVTI